MLLVPTPHQGRECPAGVWHRNYGTDGLRGHPNLLAPSPWLRYLPPRALSHAARWPPAKLASLASREKWTAQSACMFGSPNSFISHRKLINEHVVLYSSLLWPESAFSQTWDSPKTWLPDLPSWGQDLGSLQITKETSTLQGQGKYKPTSFKPLNPATNAGWLMHPPWRKTWGKVRLCPTFRGTKPLCSVHCRWYCPCFGKTRCSGLWCLTGESWEGRSFAQTCLFKYIYS